MPPSSDGDGRNSKKELQIATWETKNRKKIHANFCAVWIFALVIDQNGLKTFAPREQFSMSDKVAEAESQLF
jgi:hypothetical protein